MWNIFHVRLLLTAFILTFSHLTSAELVPVNESHETKMFGDLLGTPFKLIGEQVKDNYRFYGLASYYNNLSYYIVDKNTVSRLDEDEVVVLDNKQWLAVVGHFNVMVVKAAGLVVRLDESVLIIENPKVHSHSDAIVNIITKTELPLIAPELDKIRYAHLWTPLAWLAKLIEFILTEIRENLVSNWGMAVILFSILMKLLLLPVSVLSTRYQRRVSQIQAALEPRLAEIKASYNGEEAHKHAMEAHRDLGVSPFYTLKPMLGTIVQVPVLIAVFNALAEMPQFIGESFLWVNDLAYPDVVGHLEFGLPMFGNTISFLPFAMTAITLFSTVTFRNHHAPVSEIKRQKRNLYLMAAAFFVLFYPFPAVMVLYWASANLLQAIAQQIVRIYGSSNLALGILPSAKNRTWRK